MYYIGHRGYKNAFYKEACIGKYIINIFILIDFLICKRDSHAFLFPVDESSFLVLRRPYLKTVTVIPFDHVPKEWV